MEIFHFDRHGAEYFWIFLLIRRFDSAIVYIYQFDSIPNLRNRKYHNNIMNDRRSPKLYTHVYTDIGWRYWKSNRKQVSNLAAHAFPLTIGKKYFKLIVIWHFSEYFYRPPKIISDFKNRQCTYKWMQPRKRIQIVNSSETHKTCAWVGEVEKKRERESVWIDRMH